MLAKKYSLRFRHAFNMLRPVKAGYVCSVFVMKAVYRQYPSDISHDLFGVITPRYVGNSPKRHLVRRRIKVALRMVYFSTDHAECANYSPPKNMPIDFLIIARRDIEKCAFSHLAQHIKLAQQHVLRTLL